MGTRYFTDKDRDKKRKSYYRFLKDEETGDLRGFNGLDEELTLSEVKEIIEGLTASYLNIDRNEYVNRTLDQINYDVDTDFEQFNEGPPLKKPFRNDLKRHYSIECVNCLKKISTKNHEGYWIAQTWHNQIHGKKFCSEWCANKYIDEIKKNTIKERKLRYKL